MPTNEEIAEAVMLLNTTGSNIRMLIFRKDAKQLLFRKDGVWLVYSDYSENDEWIDGLDTASIIKSLEWLEGSDD